MIRPTVKEIIKDWLLRNGYDGLYNDDCWCMADDLWACGNIGECLPGYRQNKNKKHLAVCESIEEWLECKCIGSQRKELPDADILKN